MAIKVVVGKALLRAGRKVLGPAPDWDTYDDWEDEREVGPPPSMAEMAAAHRRANELRAQIIAAKELWLGRPSRHDVTGLSIERAHAILRDVWSTENIQRIPVSERESLKRVVDQLSRPDAGRRMLGKDIGPPRWVWITEAYAQAMGLEEVPIYLPRRGGLSPRSPLGETLAPPTDTQIHTGIVVDGWAYIKHPAKGAGYVHWRVARELGHC